MRSLNTRLSHGLLGGSIYLTGWYPDGPALQLAQMGAIGLLLLAGFFSALSGGTLRLRPSAVEWLFSAAFVFAMLVAWATGNLLSTLYGAMLLLVLAAIAFLVRHERAHQLGAVFRRAYLALLATLLLHEPQAWFASLGGHVEYGLGLVRYHPLGMHPNLCGLVYGGGALLFVQHALVVPRTAHKLFALATAALCLSVMLAASARAGMLALAVTAVTAAVLVAARGSGRARLGLVVAALAGLALVLLKWGALRDYLALILDVDSPTRGVESGATGRTDLWRAGIELVFSDGALAFTGRGIRAALPELIGFPVESSYINLALEHGLVFGSLMVLAYLVTAGRALHQGLRPGPQRAALLLAGLMLVFILAQSFFNRYLIGVGNPYSLWILVLLLRLNLRPHALRRPLPRGAHDPLPWVRLGPGHPAPPMGA